MAKSDTTVKMDMTKGNLFKQILLFSLPLVASGILQQSFNAVDVMVVGKFSSHQALAAVGSNGAIINILINLFLGVSVGANVVISNYIGRKNKEGIRKAIATVGAFALASGFFLLFTGSILARPILEMMNTPADVIDLATKYLKIYFLGMPFMMAYNFGAAVLRSLGDTKRPFYSLVIAGIVNTVLNLILVIRFGMSVEGVAIATVTANLINAAFIVYWLMRESDPYTLDARKMRIHRAEMKKMLQIGVPAGLQGVVFSIANIFIQASINKYGSNAIAGSSAALNYEVYCYFIMTAFCQAAVAFVSQNYGAGRYDRCRKAFRLCMLMAVVTCGAANMIITFNSRLFMEIFTSDPTAIEYGTVRLHYVLMLQFLAASYEVSGSALRGVGYSMTPTVLTIFGTCVLRLLWIYLVCAHNNSFGLLLSIYPITWVITGTAVLTAYLLVTKKVYAEHIRTV